MLPTLAAIIAEDLRKQRRISFTVSATGAVEAPRGRASFTESASAAAEAHSRRAGGGENSRG